MLTFDFVTAGNATFTVEPPAAFAAQVGCKPHYTFKVRKKDATDRYPETYFVSLLVGPENTADYQYLGILEPETGVVRLTKASGFGEDSWPVKILRRVLARLAADEGDQIAAAGWKVHHEGRCGRCGRALTVPASIESGIGPECAGKLLAFA